MYIMSKPRKFPTYQSRGQALLEFALVLPVLLLIFFVIIEFARLFSAWLVIENVARTAGRYAVTGQFESIHCPSEDADGQPLCVDQDEEDLARLETIRQIGYSTAAGIQRDGFPPVISRNNRYYYNVIICGSRVGDPPIVWDDGKATGADPSCTPTEFPGDPGQRVIIYVEFDHPLITPLRVIADWVPLIAQREMVVERFRAVRIAGVPPTVIVPSPTPSNTPTPTETYTPSATPTPSNTSTPSDTPTPSNTPTPTRTPSITPTPSNTLTPTPTRTPSNTPTPQPTRTFTATRTPSNTPTFGPSPTPTNTRTPTISPTPSNTRTPRLSPTPSRTPTVGPSNTNTPTDEPVGPTPTRTPTPVVTPPNTNTPTATDIICYDC
jgi:hypothetical protein